VSRVAEPTGWVVGTPDDPPGVASGASRLRVGGFTPLSTCDWPGRLAATVFCQGCPLRCGYCHNPDLIPFRAPTSLGWEDVISVLRRRRGLLDAVVFSGGEPTAQPAVADAMREVREAGLLIGLHTSGAYPRRLRRLLPLVDWVGLDVKAPPRLYEAVSGSKAVVARMWESLDLLREYGTAFEVRTTLHPALDPEALLELAVLLGEREVPTAALQTRHDADPMKVRRTADLPERVLAGWRDQVGSLILRE
jgi:pyruvate formate lyase activating enzyme